MRSFRHNALIALTLAAATVSAYAHMPCDILSAPIRVHSRQSVVHASFENSLVLCDSASSVVTNYYAADGSRLVQSDNGSLRIFVLDHGDPIRRPVAELDAYGQPLRYFVWGNGLVVQIEAGSGVVRYFHADRQGSTLALTDASAAVTDQWFHDPYGETLNRTGSTATPYQWIGVPPASSTALSPYRVTREGESFIRYESSNPAFTRVTPSGGVVPGTYAAPASDGIISLGQRGTVYNLPDPSILRPNVLHLNPPVGTPVIGPRPVAGGTGNEVLFWMGY